MQISAGLVIIQDNRILLVHPTQQSWYGTFSIPKGHLEEGEDYLETALRETQEEIGLSLNLDTKNNEPDGCIDYKDDHGQIYKKVFYFVVEPEELIEINNNNLEHEEVDYAAFYDLKEAEKRIFWRFKPLLKHLK